MIKSIRLQNWKSFADATLLVQPLTVLVGTNASGKTNLFEAFSFLKRFVGGMPFEEIFKEEHNSFSVRGGRSWLIRHGESNAKLCVTMEHPSIPDELVRYEIKFKRGTADKLRVESEALSGKSDKDSSWTSYLSSKWEKDGLYTFKGIGQSEGEFYNPTGSHCMLIALSSFFSSGLLGELVIAVAKRIGESYFINPVPDAMRGYTKIGNEIKVDASNAAGVLVARDQDGKNSDLINSLNRHIGLLPDFDLVKIYAEAIKPLEKDAMLFGVEKLSPANKEGFLVDAQTMSDGTLHFIGILTALLTVPKGSLLIMEEINQGLHPSRAKDLINIIMEIIQERKIDVMFSTHDPALLDAVGLRFSENVQVVYRNEKGESGVKTLRDFSGFAKLMGRGTLGTLSTRGELTEPTFQ